MNQLRSFFVQHPRLASWMALSVGMVGILLWSARGAGLSGTQLVWLVLAVIGLAAACAWIIGLEPDACARIPDM
ncbi:MAG: hypothetical protein ACYC5M_14845 [Anaerolineae bacterium]